MGLVGQAMPQPKVDPSAVQRVLIAALKAVHSPQVSQALIQGMQQLAKNPPAALAQAALTVMNALFQKSKGSIPPTAVLAALPKILPMVAELAVASKLFQVSKQTLDQALQMMKAQLQKSAQSAQQQGQQQPQGQPPAQAQPAPAAPMQQAAAQPMAGG